MTPREGHGPTPQIGVVCTTTRDAAVGRRARHADNYLVCSDGRQSWLEAGSERSTRGGGAGVLLAVSDGESGDAEMARTAAQAVCRALGKLWQGVPPREPTVALIEFIAAAHTRMYWKARDRALDIGASFAVAWILEDRLHWAEVGTARVYLWREGELRRLGLPWEPGELQRFAGGSEGLGDDAAIHLMVGRNAGTLKLAPGDQVLLVTDGFWRTVDMASSASLLQHVDDAQTAAVTLMERALSRGAADNITVAVADLRPRATATVRVAAPVDDDADEPTADTLPGPDPVKRELPRPRPLRDAISKP